MVCEPRHFEGLAEDSRRITPPEVTPGPGGERGLAGKWRCWTPGPAPGVGSWWRAAWPACLPYSPPPLLPSLLVLFAEAGLCLIGAPVWSASVSLSPVRPPATSTNSPASGHCLGLPAEGLVMWPASLELWGDPCSSRPRDSPGAPAAPPGTCTGPRKRAEVCSLRAGRGLL